MGVGSREAQRVTEGTSCITAPASAVWTSLDKEKLRTKAGGQLPGQLGEQVEEPALSILGFLQDLPIP